MLADPQVVTIDGSAITLPRTLTGTAVGKFATFNTELTSESTVKNGRIRSVTRLSQVKVTADPLISTTNVVVNDSISLTINRPTQGFSDDDVLKQVVGFLNWLTASTNANLKKIIAGEN